MKSKQFLKEGFVEDANEVNADHEVQMARADLFHAAEDALSLHKLLRNVSEQQGLEGWVAAKITLAADYLNTVREHIEYQLMAPAPMQDTTAEFQIAETSDYSRRRDREEDIISGEKPARQRTPAQTSDYAKRRAQEKKSDQGVAEGLTDGEYSRVLTALRLYYPGRFSMEELNSPNWYRVIANKANVTPEYAGQVIDDFVKASQRNYDDEEEFDMSDDGADYWEPSKGTNVQKEAEYRGMAEAKGEMWRVLMPRSQGGYSERYYVVKGYNKDLKIWKSKSGAGDFTNKADAEAKATELNKRESEEQVTETSAGSVAGVVNPTPKNKAKVGTLFGGTYKQKKST